jgi:chemotaxis protein methyltransferase CheR
MSSQATSQDVLRFRAAITHRIGLQFDDARLGFLGEVLQRRLDKLGQSSEDYLRGLEREPLNGETTALARELTVGETYFFRNIEQFRALAEVALLERMSSAQGTRTLRLLSAACASGEEAYSMAIVARETITDPSWQVMIRAVDLNPAALEKSQRARYTPWALRETPMETQSRWFRPDGRDLVLDETIRSAVTFGAANLGSEDPTLWLPATYDVVFCRNVLMYFSAEQMRAVIERIAQSLAPGGFLFLGHAETLRGISDEFHLRHTHGTFYYERKALAGRCRDPRMVQPQPRQGTALAAPAAPNDAWFHAICRATERVAALVPPQDRCNAALPSGPRREWDTAVALDLLRNERYADALRHVRAGPAEAERDPGVLLLEATLLAHSGQVAAAEEVCRRLLLIDELDAGAHYVLGHCREQAGDTDGAGEHYRVAAYLDPEFAMPHLHLGLMARRAGERNVARRELAQALVLLKREAASRLLLFGGGFGRKALTALCESALKDCGARP